MICKSHETCNSQFHRCYKYMHYCLDSHLGINDWDFIIFEQCKTHKHLKESENYWQQQLNFFYPLDLKGTANLKSRHK